MGVVKFSDEGYTMKFEIGEKCKIPLDNPMRHLLP